MLELGMSIPKTWVIAGWQEGAQFSFQVLSVLEDKIVVKMVILLNVLHIASTSPFSSMILILDIEVEMDGPIELCNSW